MNTGNYVTFKIFHSLSGQNTHSLTTSALQALKYPEKLQKSLDSLPTQRLMFQDLKCRWVHEGRRVKEPEATGATRRLREDLLRGECG